MLQYAGTSQKVEFLASFLGVKIPKKGRVCSKKCILEIYIRNSCFSEEQRKPRSNWSPQKSKTRGGKLILFLDFQVLKIKLIFHFVMKFDYTI